MGVSADCKPWTTQPGFMGRGLRRTERALELIDLAAVQTLVSSSQPNPIQRAQRDRAWMRKQLSGVLVDLSQNPVRRCFTKNGKTPCLTTSSNLYCFKRDSLLLPEEYMMLQGHQRTISIPDAMTGKQVQELAGEGMSLPSLALIVWRMVLVNNLP